MNRRAWRKRARKRREARAKRAEKVVERDPVEGLFRESRAIGRQFHVMCPGVLEKYRTRPFDQEDQGDLFDGFVGEKPEPEYFSGPGLPWD